MTGQSVYHQLIVRLGIVVRRGASTTTLLGVFAVLLASVPALAEFAYVPNGMDRTVSVINTANNTVAATINLPEPDRFPVGVAVNPSGTRVYVTNTCDSGFLFGTVCEIGDAGSVTVINAATNTVITTIPIPKEPVGIGVSPDGSRVYVANGCGPDCLGADVQGSVSVIDTAAGSATENTVVGNIPLPDAYSIGLAVSQDGSRVYVTNLFDLATGTTGTVSVIDTANNSVISTIEVPPLATGVVLNPNSPRLYVASLTGSVSVIDTTNNTLILTDTSAGFIGLAIKPDGTRLYAPALGGGIAVFDTTDDALSVAATVPLPPSLGGVGLTAHPDGLRVYLTSLSDNSVSVIDTATNLISGAPIPVGQAPTAFGQFIPPASVQGLVALVESFNLKPGIAKSLLAKLQNVLVALASANAGQRQDAINKLNAFLSEVEAQRGKALTDAQADQLKNMANNLIAVLTVNITLNQSSSPLRVQTAGLAVTGIQSLIEVANSFNLKQGIDSSSDAKLEAAQAALAATNAGQTQAAIQQLESFIDAAEDQRGNGLTGAQVSILVKAARHIIALL